jgi:hypothetical protein
LSLSPSHNAFRTITLCPGPKGRRPRRRREVPHFGWNTLTPSAGRQIRLVAGLAFQKGLGLGRRSSEFHQPQRGCETKPRVVPRGGTTLGKNVRNGANRNAVVARPCGARLQNPVGVLVVWSAVTQGCPRRANPGLEATAPLGLERQTSLPTRAEIAVGTMISVHPVERTSISSSRPDLAQRGPQQGGRHSVVPALHDGRNPWPDVRPRAFGNTPILGRQPGRSLGGLKCSFLRRTCPQAALLKRIIRRQIPYGPLHLPESPLVGAPGQGYEHKRREPACPGGYFQIRRQAPELETDGQTQ